MFLNDTLAKSKFCVLSQSPYDIGPRMRPNKVTGGTGTCYGGDCVAYWRWADDKHERGYCSLGSKPEF